MNVSLSRVGLCDPTDCSPPGSSVHGVLRARISEWVAIPFSRGGLPNSGIKPGSPTLQADSLLSEPQESLLTGWLNSKSFWPGLSGFHSSLHFFSPWEINNTPTLGLIFSDMLTRRVIMSLKPGAREQNFEQKII